jgi:mRNA interferase RelE/StbE
LTASKPKPATKKALKRKYKYRLKFVPEALEEYLGLDGSIRATLKKLLAKRLDSPHVPGGALHGDLVGCYKIKLLKQGVRLVYQVEDDALVVLVLAVDRREDNAVYKSAMARLVDAANDMAAAVKTALKTADDKLKKK